MSSNNGARSVIGTEARRKNERTKARRQRSGKSDQLNDASDDVRHWLILGRGASIRSFNKKKERDEDKTKKMIRAEVVGWSDGRMLTMTMTMTMTMTGR
jgi:hypothetical protein